jgi:23S rRNA pseudouridine2605 synthase
MLEIPARLSKRLSDTSGLSHKGLRAAIVEGRVQVQAPGEAMRVAWRWDEVVLPEDRVWLDGEELAKRAPRVWALLHKPAGVVSTRSEPSGRPSLGQWLDELGAGVFPVGRLDAATTGIILLTDDGDLSHMLLHPRHHVEKTYRLRLRGRLRSADERLVRMMEGIDLGDGKPPARLLSLRITALGGSWTAAYVSIDEGRHRQLRKMCRLAGLYLEQLCRVGIGPLRLGALGSGEVRHLTADEVARLWEGCGGREEARRRATEALAQHAGWLRERGQPHERLDAWLREHVRG